MQFVEDAFPVVVLVSPVAGWDESTIRAMAAKFEEYWRKRQRYALITHTPRGSAAATAKTRKLITDWANEPKVREMSARWCVASATIVPNAIARGALTAMLWVWTPSSPHHVAGTPEEALDFCLDRIAKANVALPDTPEAVRRSVLRVLRET
jgi:hypothetical protein